MEFSSRGPQAPSPSSFGQHEASSVNRTHADLNKKVGRGDWTNNKAYRIVQSVLVVCVLIVVIGLLVFLAVGDWTNHSESSYIQSNKLQAVFLNTGQVYFGNINKLNDNYLVLTNIFYLQTNSSSTSSTTTSTTPTSVSLVKLGCEIHAPLDQMIINRDSVTFWENLSPSGQVAKAVATWEKDNPNGQKCSDQSTAGTSGTTTTQNATDNTGDTTTTNQ
ncbi:MAG TPA: hypothetical protein VGF75_07350 [Candidatus Saccharimonadales bacterium]|jgi:hypothetical protein